MNVEWTSRLPASLRRRLYFGLQSLIGSNVASVWREFQDWQRLDAEELEDRVEQKLSAVLNAAAQTSAYYRNLGIVRRVGERASEYLLRFPPLERSTVREQFSSIVVDALRNEIASTESRSRKRYDWVVVKTGGTTGTPTAVVHDARGRDWGRASRLFAAQQCGHPLGTPYFRLWGSEADLLNTEASLQTRLQMSLLGAVEMNAFRATEKDLRQHHQTLITNPHIKSMMAYVDVATTLALFIREHGLERPRLDSIMACASTVTPDARQLLQETFAANVFDKYGSRDCCEMACECREHDGLHVVSPNVVLEVVDDQGLPCAPGQTGHVLVTLLNNPSFPMIRYRIGDLAEWASREPCPCGLAWPRIKSLQGRADDMLVTDSGALLAPAYVRHTVGVSLNRNLIWEWQLEQTGRTTFVFRYVPMKAVGLIENLSELDKRFKLAFGANATIQMEEVREISPSASGKTRWIFNSWKAASGGSDVPKS